MSWTGPVLPALPSISYPRKRNPTWNATRQVALSGKRTVYSLFTYPIYAYELPLNYLRTDQALSGMAAADRLHQLAAGWRRPVRL
jgi:hypothetical protein